MENNYVPAPRDTTCVQLPEELVSLGDKIAENVHDVWAAGRIADGWSYGKVRDDAKKQHPCLVPYGELSDSEKSYDLNTAFETLKLIITLGYEIIKK